MGKNVITAVTKTHSTLTEVCGSDWFEPEELHVQ